MADLTISGAYSTQADLKACVEKFRSLDSGVISFEIELVQSKVEIDLVFISYLMLFRIERPELQICFHALNLQDEYLSKLKQYMTNAYLMVGVSVFNVVVSGGEIKEVQSSDNGQWVFPTDKDSGWLVVSQSFIAPLFIDGRRNGGEVNESIQKFLFKETTEVFKTSLDRLPNGVTFNRKWNEEEFYQELNDKIRLSLSPSDRERCLETLTQLHYYRALERANILRIRLDPKFKRGDVTTHRQDLQVSRITYMGGTYSFYDEIVPIFDELRDKPAIYHFVFCSILTSGILPSEFNSDNKVQIQSILKSLWAYTKELVRGFQELVLNIQHHSSERVGVFTGRVYKKSVWDELKRTDYEVIETLRKSFDTVERLIDFNVVDLGNVGVIDRLKQDSEGLSKAYDGIEALKSIYDEDIERIKEGHVRFEHFLNPNAGNTLSQQAKRATSHLGLLIFSKLVIENNGLLRAGTIAKKEDGTVSSDAVAVYKGEAYSYPNALAHGTHYHVVLPVLTNKAYESILPLPIVEPQGTDQTLFSLHELLEFDTCVYERGLEAPARTERRALFQLRFQNQDIGRDDEFRLFRELSSLLEGVVFKSKRDILCVDLHRVSLRGSSLFRFLGNLSLLLPKEHMIVSGIDAALVREVCRINDGWGDGKQDFPYWGKDTVFILFSHVDMTSGGAATPTRRFNFADALWGETKADFLAANRLIQRTNFNLVSLMYASETNDINSAAALSGTKLFRDGPTLLPFDLLIEGNEGMTLFEQNSMSLIQTELKYS